MISLKNNQLFTIIDPESSSRPHRKLVHPQKRKLYQFNNQTPQQHHPELLADSPTNHEQYDQFISGQSHEVVNTTLTQQHKILTRSLTSAKKKEKQAASHQGTCDQNIFKYPSSILSTNITNNSIRLPALGKKSTIYDEMGDISSTRRKKVKIPMQKLKALPVDEVKRRFMEKYRKELIKM